jgi:hypothetical protein
VWMRVKERRGRAKGSSYGTFYNIGSLIINIHCLTNTYIRTRTHSHAHPLSHTHTLTHAHSHINAHTHTHAHARKHTHTCCRTCDSFLPLFSPNFNCDNSISAITSGSLIFIGEGIPLSFVKNAGKILASYPMTGTPACATSSGNLQERKRLGTERL